MRSEWVCQVTPLRFPFILNLISATLSNLLIEYANTLIQIEPGLYSKGLLAGSLNRSES